jgi:threonine aldolase
MIYYELETGTRHTDEIATKETDMKTFKSDNTASVHPLIMDELMKVNIEHAAPYGDDDVTRDAAKQIKDLFGGNCDVSFVLNGTGANVIGLSGMMKPYEAVICADTAHINVDECGAFERYTSAKLITVPHIEGKITIEQIRPLLEAVGNEHHSQPKVISISQLTEWGTAYSIQELKALAAFAHDHKLLLHVDGARIANAAVALGVSFKEMITDTGVDMLSFGGAKNGMMYGEAIVSFNAEASSHLKYIRKQGMQLMSKMRYISAQYIGFLKNNLWHSNAQQANDQMARLYEGMKLYSEIEFKAIPEGNMMFVTLPQVWIDTLLTSHYFYQMATEGDRGLIRLVTSFDTHQDEVDRFLEDLQQIKVRKTGTL